MKGTLVSGRYLYRVGGLSQSRRRGDVRIVPAALLPYSLVTSGGHCLRAESGTVYSAWPPRLPSTSRDLSEELKTQRRFRFLASKSLHKLMQYSGREVGLCGGGTLINRNATGLQSYISVRNRTRRPVPTFGTGVMNPEFWSTREEGWTDRRKEWVSVLAELPVLASGDRSRKPCWMTQEHEMS